MLLSLQAGKGFAKYAQTTPETVVDALLAILHRSYWSQSSMVYSSRCTARAGAMAAARAAG
jgi:hypothetical protein